jgi:hypothetical protein
MGGNDMGKTVANHDDLPEWLANGLRSKCESCVDGERWVTDGHIAFRLEGQLSAVGAGPIGELLATRGVRGADISVRPGAALLEAEGSGHEPSVRECDDCGEWLSCDGRGSLVSHYYVPMVGVDGLRLSLCYATVIPYIFGNVQWFGTGPREPVVVKVDGEVVAVIMPAPKALSAGQDARP